MPLREKATQMEDFYLLEILRNPVLMGEFINNYDKTPDQEPFEFTKYQREWLCDFNDHLSICCARAVGKTLYLVSLYVWYLVFNIFPNDYVTYGVPAKVHLEPVWTGLVRQFRTNSLLKMFISPNAGINGSDFKITLLNQATMLCRIAGQSGTGNNFVGLHQPIIAFDESGYFPFGAFLEAQPTLNTFTPGHKMIVSGVPDGRREKSVCYHADQENGSYSKHRINSLQNPRFSEKDLQDAKILYGGEESDDYQHLVLGLHGRPVFSLFDRGMMEMSNDEVYKLEIDGTKLQDNIMEYFNKLSSFPGLPEKRFKCLIGVDLGFTEPTAIIIMYLDSSGRIHFHGRIKLTKVGYPIQEKLIDYLDTKFEPILIGVDKGSAGISVIQHLMQDSAYRNKEYSTRVESIDFSSSVILGKDTEGKDITVKTKPFSVQVLQDYSNNHKIIYSSRDPELITELERMTYSKTPSGEIVYRTLTVRGGQKGEDHFTAALLCGTLAYYLKNESFQSRTEKIKLFRPMWINN